MDRKAIILKRKYLRKKVTEKYNIYNEILPLSRVERLQFLEMIKGLSDEISQMDNEVFELSTGDEFSDTDRNNELDDSFMYKTKISDMIVAVQHSLNTADVSASISGGSGDGMPSLATSSLINHKLKPPTAPLPEYKCGPNECLSTFFCDFEAVISKFNFSEYEKFILMKKQVHGRALILIESLESAKHTYDDAKDFLLSALESPISQKFKILKNLVSLDLKYDQDPYVHASQMKVIKDSITKLNIDMSCVVQYFYWQGFNESLRSIFTNITNSAYPSLIEIEQNLFEALRRYELVQEKYNKKKKGKGSSPSGKSVSVGAVNVKAVNNASKASSSSFKPCTLCSGDTGHPIFKCPAFKTPKEKVERLKAIGGCTKCSYLNHNSESCRYKFKNKCIHCKAFHFSFLCDKNSSVTNDKNSLATNDPVPGPSAASNLVWNGLASGIHEGSALPTFSCKIGNHYIRAMRDSGSQINILCDKLLQNLHYKVLKNDVKLTINGFNGPKVYNTQLVEFDVLIGADTFTIDAVCMPDINISLKLPGVTSLCKKLVERGYKLADKNLLHCDNKINDIGLILGTPSSYCLPVRTLVFGSSGGGFSTLLETPCGYMLEGSIDGMMSNMNCISSDPVDCVPAVNTECDSFSLSVNTCSLLNSQLDISDDNFGDVHSPEKMIHEVLNCDDPPEETSVDGNIDLFNFLLKNTKQLEDGFIEMPILWDGKICHKLGNNLDLAKNVLKSSLRKFEKNENVLKMTNEVFATQEKDGIIERVDDIGEYMSTNPSCSFLAHMSVIKLDRQTTKCRVVYLSNLSQRNHASHNQCILPGLNLNHSIIINLTLMRLNKFLLIFDIKRAFHNICLSDLDASKFLFVWVRDVEKKDFTPIYFRSKRLPFGLPCSPFLLLVALYKILIVDGCASEHNLDFELLYQQCYMDNLSYSCNSEKDIMDAYHDIPNVFSPYNFLLQQFVTNSHNLQDNIDLQQEEKTPEIVKLLGVLWNRSTDELHYRSISLDLDATTKRQILASLARNFDPLGIAYPLLNRARLFVNTLQNDESLKWDTKISKNCSKEWSKICKQVNVAPDIKIPRFIGCYSDKFTLNCFTDTSKLIYGIVIYLQNDESNEVSFLFSCGRIISKSLSRQSIPALELHALTYGIEKVSSLYDELTGASLLKTLNITKIVVWTDSMVCLSWVDQFTDNIGKLFSKRNVFVLNRLNKIQDVVRDHPVTLKFVVGSSNPADKVTRAISYSLLSESNFHSGPSVLLDAENLVEQSVKLPKHTQLDGSYVHSVVSTVNTPSDEVPNIKHLVPINKFSSFRKIVHILMYALLFVLKLKGSKSENLCTTSDATIHLIKTDQKIHFPNIYKSLSNPRNKIKDIPHEVKQFNLFIDKHGLIRVAGKFGKNNVDSRNPIFLSKDSQLTKLIVRGLHEDMSHIGLYSLLGEFRRRYFVPKIYSFIKGILHQCVVCRRFNQKAIKLNQSNYREFRTDPPAIPFRSLFLDYLGPYQVFLSGSKFKVWVIIFTCLYCRGVNMRVVRSLDVKNFLLAFQLHVHEFGLPGVVISDAGSQIGPAGNIITNFLNDVDTRKYLDENSIGLPSFQQFCKGNSSLGSIVEICVKMSKKLIYGSIRNNVVEYDEFIYVVSLAKTLINRRPIGFKEMLRDDSVIPDPITPEMLIRGSSLVMVNIVPGLHENDFDPEYKLGSPDTIKNDFAKLCKIKEKLNYIYENEFLKTLMDQAIDQKDRYKYVHHNKLSVGDIVLIKEKFQKPAKFNLGVVTELQVNKFNEVTSAVVFKGSTKEYLHRHATTLVKLLSPVREGCDADDTIECEAQTAPVDDSSPRIRRLAAQKCIEMNKSLLNNDLI